MIILNRFNFCTKGIDIRLGMKWHGIYWFWQIIPLFDIIIPLFDIIIAHRKGNSVHEYGFTAFGLSIYYTEH